MKLIENKILLGVALELRCCAVDKCLKEPQNSLKLIIKKSLIHDKSWQAKCLVSEFHLTPGTS